MDSISTTENRLRDQKSVVICKWEQSINQKDNTDNDNNELDDGSNNWRDWEGSTTMWDPAVEYCWTVVDGQGCRGAEKVKRVDGSNI